MTLMLIAFLSCLIYEKMHPSKALQYNGYNGVQQCAYRIEKILKLHARNTYKTYVVCIHSILPTCVKQFCR